MVLREVIILSNYYIAVDFDGTLTKHSSFPDIGVRNEKVIKELSIRVKRLSTVYDKVVLILWTCREDIPKGDYLTQAVEWVKNNIPELKFTYVNENPDLAFGYPELARKICANEYWDDLCYNPVRSVVD